jgi:hypothetical protein
MDGTENIHFTCGRTSAKGVYKGTDKVQSIDPMSDHDDQPKDDAAPFPNDEFAYSLIRSYFTAHGLKDVVRVLDSELPEVCDCQRTRSRFENSVGPFSGRSFISLHPLLRVFEIFSYVSCLRV